MKAIITPKNRSNNSLKIILLKSSHFEKNIIHWENSLIIQMSLDKNIHPYGLPANSISIAQAFTSFVFLLTKQPWATGLKKSHSEWLRLNLIFENLKENFDEINHRTI